MEAGGLHQERAGLPDRLIRLQDEPQRAGVRHNKIDNTILDIPASDSVRTVDRTFSAGSRKGDCPMSFEFLKHPRKVNLGCGFDRKQGFLNIDINTSHDPDLVCDVPASKMQPFGVL